MTDPRTSALWRPWAPADDEPPVFVGGDGSYLVDANGRRYLDAKGCVLNATYGYRCRPVIDAVTRQMTRLMNVDHATFVSEQAVELAERIAALVPDPLRRTFFVGSGSEATETAIKMARMFFALRGASERHVVVSVTRGYHGATLGALAASPFPPVLEGIHPLPEGFAAVPQPQCTRCARGDEHGSCDDGVGDALQMLDAIGCDRVAAFLIEPVLGIGGVIVPPPGYLRGIEEFCRAHGILFVVDETMTGYGRTGTMFAFEFDELVPDIVISGKGLAGGYMQIAAVTATDEIYEAFRDDPMLGGFRHGHTNSAHATACAAANTVLRLIEEDHLVERVRLLGERVKAQLSDIKDDRVVDVRGRGLLLALEYTAEADAREVTREAFELGLIVREQDNVITLAPPLNIDDESADKMVELLVKAHSLSVATRRGV